MQMEPIEKAWLSAGFPVLLWDSLQLCGYTQPPTFKLHKGLETELYLGQFTIPLKYGTPGEPISATGFRMLTPILALNMAAREAPFCIWDVLPEMRQPATFY